LKNLLCIAVGFASVVPIYLVNYQFTLKRLLVNGKDYVPIFAVSEKNEDEKLYLTCGRIGERKMKTGN
jgi:hypothetical protein